MNLEDEITDFKIIHIKADPEQVHEEVTSAAAPDNLIAALAEHTVRLRDKNVVADAEDLWDCINRDFNDGVLPGFLIPGTDDRVRGYALSDVEAAMRSKRYRKMLAEFEFAAANELARRRQIEEKKAKKEAEYQKAFDAEKASISRVFDFLVERMSILETEVRSLRGVPARRSGSFE